MLSRPVLKPLNVLDPKISCGEPDVGKFWKAEN